MTVDPWLNDDFSDQEDEEEEVLEDLPSSSNFKRIDAGAPKKKVRITHHKPPTSADEYLFFAKSVQASVIRQLFDVLDRLLNDINIYVDESGMKVATMDKAKNCLIHLKLIAREFEDYQCRKPLTLGVNMSDLAKLVKSAGQNDTVVMYVTTFDVERLWIRVDSKVKQMHSESYLKLLDLTDHAQDGFEDWDFSYVITLPSTILQKICREQRALTKEVTIISKPQHLIFQCHGDNSGQTYTILETVNGMTMSKEDPNGEVISATYSLVYLLTFAKATSMYPTVELYIADDFITLLYAVGTLGEFKVALTAQLDDEE